VNILDQQWACLTCNNKFPVGEVVIPAGGILLAIRGRALVAALRH